MPPWRIGTVLNDPLDPGGAFDYPPALVEDCNSARIVVGGFDLRTWPDDLKNSLVGSSFIVHLAGLHRPKPVRRNSGGGLRAFGELHLSSSPALGGLFAIPGVKFRFVAILAAVDDDGPGEV